MPELMDRTFVKTDEQLADRKGLHSGCTAVVAYIRLEDDKSEDTAVVPDGAEAVGADGTSQKRRQQVCFAFRGSLKPSVLPPNHPFQRRVLYTANVGDARVVLCRDGKAVRLSYDHKGSDPMEQQRVADAGGFVVNNRVNGVLLPRQLKANVLFVDLRSSSS